MIWDLKMAHINDYLAPWEPLVAPFFYVPGNHDLPSLDLPGNIDGTVVELDGLRVGGLGGAGPARFGFA